MEKSIHTSTPKRAHLGERAKMILVMRYMHDMTLDQVGQALGITRERVRQIESRAMVVIRARKDLRDRALASLGHDA
jgi:DNA-directed RNA polymerase sigma subunit (sigma70/sigma32)